MPSLSGLSSCGWACLYFSRRRLSRSPRAAPALKSRLQRNRSPVVGGNSPCILEATVQRLAISQGTTRAQLVGAVAQAQRSLMDPDSVPDEIAHKAPALIRLLSARDWTAEPSLWLPAFAT